MNLFTINGKEYEAKEFDFNLVCDLEDMGVSLEQFNAKPRAASRAYFSLCAYVDKDTAGKEIEAHIVAGGTLEELMRIIYDKLQKSDFFQAIQKRAETKTRKYQAKTE